MNNNRNWSGKGNKTGGGGGGGGGGNWSSGGNWGSGNSNWNSGSGNWGSGNSNWGNGGGNWGSGNSNWGTGSGNSNWSNSGTGNWGTGGSNWSWGDGSGGNANWQGGSSGNWQGSGNWGGNRSNWKGGYNKGYNNMGDGYDGSYDEGMDEMFNSYGGGMGGGGMGGGGMGGGGMGGGGGGGNVNLDQIIAQRVSEALGDRKRRNPDRKKEGQAKRPKPLVVRDKGEKTYCKVCKIECSNKFAYDQHINGKRHREMVNEGEWSEEKLDGIAGNLDEGNLDHEFCRICVKRITEGSRKEAEKLQSTSINPGNFFREEHNLTEEHLKNAEIKISHKYDPNVPEGQDYIKPTKGFFCKLCQTFYYDEDDAKIKHCKKAYHVQQYRRLIAAREKDREMRDKMAKDVTEENEENGEEKKEENNGEENNDDVKIVGEEPAEQQEEEGEPQQLQQQPMDEEVQELVEDS